MNDTHSVPPPLPKSQSPDGLSVPPGGGAPRNPKSSKGFFSPRIVRAASFYIILLCIVLSVFVCILAIWDFTGRNALGRMVASCLVVGVGTALFAFVNGRFGEER